MIFTSFKVIVALAKQDIGTRDIFPTFYLFETNMLESNADEWTRQA